MEFEHDIDGLFKTYQDLLPMKPEYQEVLWQKFRLDWNYNSNRIEGNTLTYGETEALLILGTEPKRLQKDIREMKAHDVGIEHLRNLARDERPISETDIRELNRIILKENYFIETETAEGNISRKEIVPGTYKTLPNHVRLRGGGIHKFAEPNEVPQRMEAVVQSIRNYVSKPANQPLAEYLAELHQDFINTHPFDDGNGRVVRMLLNYVCLKLGWPPIIIKNAKKADYLTALEQSDKGNTEPLEMLMSAELTWSLGKSIKAAYGEDIEDPDDLEKEIHMFVSEQSQKILTNETLKREFEQNLRSLFWHSLKEVDSITKKFSTMFEAVSSDPPLIQVLEQTLQVSSAKGALNEKDTQRFIFRGLKLTSQRIDLAISLKLVELNDTYVLSRTISSNCDPFNAAMRTEHPGSSVYSLSKNLQLSTKTDIIATNAQVDIFSKEIGREILKFLKCFQNN